MINAGCTPVKWILLASTFSSNPKSKLGVNFLWFYWHQTLILKPNVEVRDECLWFTHYFNIELV